MDKCLNIIGASGHGKVVADIASKCGYRDIAFFDDNPEIKECGGYPVLGAVADAYNREGGFFVAIGNAGVRERIQSQLEKHGKRLPVLIHPAAVVAPDVSFGAGSVVMAGAVINPASKIGKGCIINTSASVDHDCVIEDYVHIAVGAHIAGTVSIGSRTWVGLIAAISNNLSITDDCIIGAGAVVVKDIKEKGTYVGVPAFKIK